MTDYTFLVNQYTPMTDYTCFSESVYPYESSILVLVNQYTPLKSQAIPAPHKVEYI